MKSFAGHGARKLIACICAAAAMLLLAAVKAPSFHAAEAEVGSSEEFASALLDSSVNTININSDRATVIEYSSDYRISRTLTINGRGAALSAVEGGRLLVDSGATLTLNGLSIGGSDNYAVASNGAVVLGESVVIGSRYGISLRSGASLTSGGNNVAVSESVSSAVLVNTGGNTITLSELSLEQLSGRATMMYIAASDGKLVLGGGVTIRAANGNAFMCPTGGSCPNVTVSEGARLELSAPEAANEAGDGDNGAAMDIRAGNIIFENGSAAVITGSTNAILANNIETGDDVSLTLRCRYPGSSASSGTSNAALWAGGAITLGKNAVIDMLEPALPCNGIYTGKGLSADTGCRIQISGNGGQYSGICTPGQVTLGDGSSLSVHSIANAVICDHGMVTGDKVTLSFTDIGDYGIYAVGTLQADKLFFGEDNTINIDARKCSIYTRESVDISSGSLVELASSNRAPSLWIDADTSSQGHLAIHGASVSVRCSASSHAAHNSGVYVVGTIIVEEQSTFTVINNGDFGTIATYGDINVSTDSSFYSSGGCGIFILRGNLRLTQGGKLYAEGTVDSGVRVEHGVLNAGELTVMDIQGGRFGAELLGNSGLWITDVEDFDIRSTGDRAVYIENGTLNISGIDKLSAWLKNSRNNASRWWTRDVSDYHSWDIRSMLSADEKIYADHTMLKPNGSQEYRDGSAGSYTGFDWYDSLWSADDYSRLGIYLSRPTARSNNFYIPAGRSFSWWLNGESYAEGDLVFKITTPSEDNSVKLGSNGRFTFSANNYSLGIQEFKFIVIDSEGVSSEEATIQVNVTASKPPIVCSDTFFTGMSKNIIGQLEMYDYDGRIASTEVAVKPSHGDLLVSSDGQFSYTPEIGFSGIDTFAYYAVDNMNDKSNVGYISIAVGEQEGLIAAYDTLITESNVAVSAKLFPITQQETEELTEGGGQQDEDAQGGADAPDEQPQVEYYYEITRQPIYGKLTFTEADTVEYDPYEDFSGSDIFCYRVIGSDGSASNEGLITIATIPNQRPYAEPGSYICVSGSKRNGQLSADDVDGNIVKYEITVQPQKGGLALDERTGRFVYNAPFGYEGRVTFTFRATDNDGLSSHEAEVSIEIVSLKEYLKSTGKYKMAIVAGTCIIVSMLVIVALLISRSINKKREKKLEEEREKLLESYYANNVQSSGDSANGVNGNNGNNIS